jgi:hypothetical protein
MRLSVEREHQGYGVFGHRSGRVRRYANYMDLAIYSPEIHVVVSCRPKGNQTDSISMELLYYGSA